MTFWLVYGVVGALLAAYGMNAVANGKDVTTVYVRETMARMPVAAAFYWLAIALLWPLVLVSFLTESSRADD